MNILLKFTFFLLILFYFSRYNELHFTVLNNYKNIVLTKPLLLPILFYEKPKNCPLSSVLSTRLLSTGGHKNPSVFLLQSLFLKILMFGQSRETNYKHWKIAIFVEKPGLDQDSVPTWAVLISLSLPSSHSPYNKPWSR